MSQYQQTMPWDKLENCDDDTSEGTVVLKIFIFLSQVIFGVGTTLYYGLGQTYLNDNAKKTSTPMLLGISFGLRNTGPALGFILGYFCLKLYIVPTLHPVINDKDPRWLGAWWLGWIILGSVLSIFAILMAMFPRDLPKKQENKKKESITKGTRLEKHDSVEGLAEASASKISQSEIGKELDEEEIVPTLGDFVATLRRVFTNRLLMCNNLVLVFSVLGTLPHITFIAKYLEVQFNTSTAGGTVVTGPVALSGMVLGFIVSGFFISKVQPRPSRLLSWNALCGLSGILIQIIYIFNSCPVTSMEKIDPTTMHINFTKSCNVGCTCENVKYSPVCHRPSMTTYFSACHAGCTETIDSQTFGNCRCLLEQSSSFSLSMSTGNLGPCIHDCFKAYTIFAVLILIIQFLVATGRIGNILVNFRCVKKSDKSVAQGVTVTFVSLFALMLAPIVYGAVIHQTCLIWENIYGSNGNCWYYDKHQFRWMFNSMAIGFTFVGALLDIFICYLGQNLDLYGADETKH